MALPICLHTVCGCFCTIIAERDILTKVYKAKNIYFLAMHCLVINNLLPGHLLPGQKKFADPDLEESFPKTHWLNKTMNYYLTKQSCHELLQRANCSRVCLASCRNTERIERGKSWDDHTLMMQGLKGTHAGRRPESPTAALPGEHSWVLAIRLFPPFPAPFLIYCDIVKAAQFF